MQTEEAAHAYTVVQHGWYLTDVSQCGGDPLGDLPDISQPLYKRNRAGFQDLTMSRFL